MNGAGIQQVGLVGREIG